MYSWGCLIVTLMAIYGYRFCKNVFSKEEKNKDLILFGVFSICSCYVHYYALVSAGLINLIMLIYLIKNRKNNPKALTKFLILAGVQIVLYIPWLIYFLRQIKGVGGGFWIEVTLINTTLEVLSLQYRMAESTSIEKIFAIIFSFLIYIYIVFKMYKSKEKSKPAIISLCIYFGIIIIMAIVSIFMPILYSRYLVIVTGLYIFAVSFMISKENNKIIISMILGIVLIIGMIGNVNSMKINYDSSNMESYNYLKQELKQGDIIVYSDIVESGGSIATYFPEYKQYFINYEKWGVEEAYKAYGPGMEIVDDLGFLENYKGRIWIIYSGSTRVYDDISKQNIEILKETKTINTKYHSRRYNIMLVEKK